jgi:hypothetical protein
LELPLLVVAAAPSVAVLELPLLLCVVVLGAPLYVVVSWEASVGLVAVTVTDWMYEVAALAA